MASNDSINSKRAAYLRAYEKKNAERIKARKAAYYLANTEKFRVRAASYYQNNKAAYRERALRWVEANEEQYRAWFTLYYLEHKARYRERERERYKKNPELARARSRLKRAKNPGNAKASFDRWRAKNMHVIIHHNALRRTRKKKAQPAWANFDAIKGIYREAARLRKETGSSWHVDHVIPISHPLVCGLHCEFNLRVIPGVENKAKANLFVIE